MLGDIFVSSRGDAFRYKRLLGTKSIAPPRFELLEWKGITDVDVSVLWATLMNEPFEPKRHQLLDLVFHSHATTVLGKLRMKAAVLGAMAKELIGGESEPTFLYAFPPKLVEALTHLSTDEVPRVVETWLHVLEKPADRRAEFIDGLNQILDLATIAKSRDRTIYLWFGV
nr:hypothetical protein [uncultured Albidiferax sp.]